jgi:hypothetical protein
MPYDESFDDLNARYPAGNELLPLLRQSAEIEEQLLAHPWVNNRNKPMAEIAEFLAAEVLGGERATNNSRGHDVVLPDGKKVEVKSRRIPADRVGSQVFNVLREPFGFDAVVFIAFNMDYSIQSFTYIHREALPEVTRWSEHQNGHIASVKKVQAAYQGYPYTEHAQIVWEGAN